MYMCEYVVANLLHQTCCDLQIESLLDNGQRTEGKNNIVILCEKIFF